jgi:hypothetical protein
MMRRACPHEHASEAGRALDAANAAQFWMLHQFSAGAVHQRAALHLRVPTLMISIFCRRVRQHAASVTKKYLIALSKHYTLRSSTVKSE